MEKKIIRDEHPFRDVIPASIRVGGKLYQIKYQSDPKNGSLLGEHSDYTTEIVIHETVEGEKISRQSQLETFWHEAVHAVLCAMGRLDLNNDETFVTTVGAMLNEIMQSAKTK